MLQGILHTIAGCEIRGENHGALESLWRSWLSVARSHAEHGQRQLQPTSPWFGAHELDADSYGQALVDSFIDRVLQPSRSARYTGFKEVRYPGLGDDLHRYLEFVRRFMPNAFFVFNSRGHDEVARSKWWRNRDPAAVKEIVERMDGLFAAYAEDHLSHSVALRYEEWLADPYLLRAMFDMLGEEFDYDNVRRVIDVRLTH